MENKISFWSFIKKYAIEIPIIQRDYAQGRVGMEYLRQGFLTDIKRALDRDDILTLDFVYGSKEHDRLQPLDGQQRLTTLWLLHWYIALRAKKLNEDVCNILKRFTYETRISSREFCQNLCHTDNIKGYENQKIVEFITNRTWFYSSWKQDPTIQAMLNMLGGTRLADKQGNDIVDGIEELFQDTNENRFEEYWDKLTSKDVIVFYYLPLENFGLSDDLYIKMNARGKQLTSFENFKADLIGYIQEQAGTHLGDQQWKDLLNLSTGIPLKMDTIWTDVFWWNHRDGRIDEIYFAFLNRYLLHYAIAYKDAKEDSKAWRLYGDKSNDTTLIYNDFELYATILEHPKPFENLCKLFEFITKNIPKKSVNESIRAHLPQWFINSSNNRFDFIPIYKEEGNKISTLTQAQRVVFFGICRYFEKCDDFNEQAFSRWMRIVCNLAENTSIDTVDAMIARIKLIEELSNHIEEGIYEFLINETMDITSKASAGQLFEEREKAKQILGLGAHNNAELPQKPENWDNSKEWNWESAILYAENYAFFKGAIRFLFINAENEIDWSDFARKWQNACSIFTSGGLTEKYKESALANRIILSYCSKWEEQIQSYPRDDKRIFGFSADIWRNNILLKPKKSTDKSLLYAKSIHHLLKGDRINEELTLDDNDNFRKKALDRLVKTDIVKQVLNEKNYIRWTYGGLSLYPSSEGVVLSKNVRDKILNELHDEGIIQLASRHQMKDLTGEYKMLFGWNIDFTYSKENTDYHFRWQYGDYIDMYADNIRLCENEIWKDLTIAVKTIASKEDCVAKIEECIKQYHASVFNLS